METNSAYFLKTAMISCLCVVLAAGCGEEEAKKKDEPGVSEVHLDGGRYSRVTAKTTAAAPATAVFNPTENVTAITYTAEVGDESFVVIIAYPGNEPGEEVWKEDGCFASVIQEIDEGNHSVTASYLEEGGGVHSGYVRIDKYGAPGGIVTGSFKGDVTFIDSECACLEEGTIEGTFSATRLQ